CREAVYAYRHALGEGQRQERPAARERARVEIRQERRRQRVEPDQRIVVEEQRVRLDGTRLRIGAGDREGVDVVTEVGAKGLAPGHDRVRESLKGRVRGRHGGGGRRDGREQALGGR